MTVVRTEILDQMEASLSGILSIFKPSITLVFKFHVLCRTGVLIFMLCNLEYVHDLRCTEHGGM